MQQQESHENFNRNCSSNNDNGSGNNQSNGGKDINNNNSTCGINTMTSALKPIDRAAATGNASNLNLAGNSNPIGAIDNDNGGERASKSRPFARLDRLLRRWLPGYNYLRGCSASSADISEQQQRQPVTATEVGTTMSTCGGLNQMDFSQQLQQQLHHHRGVRQPNLNLDLPPLPPRKRKDGEVLLDAGIAKSEFCIKLEQLLRAKLIVKD